MRIRRVQKPQRLRATLPKRRAPELGNGEAELFSGTGRPPTRCRSARSLALRLRLGGARRAYRYGHARRVIRGRRRLVSWVTCGSRAHSEHEQPSASEPLPTTPVQADGPAVAMPVAASARRLRSQKRGSPRLRSRSRRGTGSRPGWRRRQRSAVQSGVSGGSLFDRSRRVRNGLQSRKNQRQNRTPCQLRWVRLGTGDPPRWISPGLTMMVKCQAVTQMSLEPGESAPEAAAPRT